MRSGLLGGLPLVMSAHFTRWAFNQLLAPPEIIVKVMGVKVKLIQAISDTG